MLVGWATKAVVVTDSGTLHYVLSGCMVLQLFILPTGNAMTYYLPKKKKKLMNSTLYSSNCKIGDGYDFEESLGHSAHAEPEDSSFECQGH